MSASNPLPSAAADLARSGDAAGLAELLGKGLGIDAQDEKGNTLLMLASYHGRAEVVELLLKAGAAVDLRNDKGQTPLGGVAFKGHAGIARLLLDAGADPKADQGGSTPADFATLAGRTEILALLESAQKTAGRPRSWFGRLAGWIRRI
ncbi:MAG: ankyrin repeat domain-containing protein [Opitutales bacterium]